MPEFVDMKIMSVDDNPNNLLMVEALAKSLGLAVESFNDPKEAMKNFINGYDLIITDYMMPDIDGIALISEFRKTDQTTPVIMLTASNDSHELHLNALEAGANDFLYKPLNAPIFKARVSNLLKLKKSNTLLEDRALLLEDEVKKATLALTHREYETLKILGKTAEYKDPETGAHVARVAHYSKMMAELFGYDEEFQNIVFHSSPFHDIGKVGIPDEILLKPGKLEGEEWEIMKSHANIGYEILKNSKSDFLKSGGIIAISHHEKFDGTGYPNGLQGNNIPTMGRIVAIADVFDALTTVRPYKPAWEIDDALAYVKEQSGKHFDPDFARLFLENKKRVIEIFHEYQED